MSNGNENNLDTLESSLTLSYKFNIHLPYNPTFPLPGIHPREMKCIYIFFFLIIIMEDLFIVIPNGKQSKYLSTGEQFLKIIQYR